jgi:hypothetical protein
MNHRRIQRALFRLQLDPGFAARVRAGDAESLGSLALGPDELALLAGADPAGLSADRDGKRRGQFLRNVSSEFALSLAVSADAKLVEEFTGAREFHEAVAADGSLPLAFARHLEARCAQASPVTRAFVALEAALARARRARRPTPALTAGEVALAPWAELVTLPEGTLDRAARVRAALDRGEATPSGVEVSEEATEVLLLRRTPEPEPFRLADVEVEHLSPELAALLARATRPLDARARSEQARAASVSRAELEEIVAGLVADRILIAG